MNMSTTQRERFWNKVAIGSHDVCWNWLGCKSVRGYGFCKLRGRMVRAHRVAYELAVGDIPHGLFVCHTCDNPSCVNPAHLFVGSHVDNMADMIRKGRHHFVKGEAHGMAKLTVAQVDEIRSRYMGKWGEQTDLAHEYGVSRSQITQIVNGKRWKQSEGEVTL